MGSLEGLRECECVCVRVCVCVCVCACVCVCVSDLGEISHYFGFKYFYALLSMSGVLKPMKYSQKVSTGNYLNPKQLHISPRSSVCVCLCVYVNALNTIIDKLLLNFSLTVFNLYLTAFAMHLKHISV